MSNPRPGVSVGAVDPSVEPEESSYDLTCFRLADTLRCGEALRHLATESASMEEAARKATGYVYERFRSQDSRRQCVLVRMFKTHPYERLSAGLREFADTMAKGLPLTGATKCLVLLGTHGDDPLWNSRRTSAGHQAIPLVSEAVVERSPMISQLIHQFGLRTADFLRATPEIIKEMDRKSYGVFHILRAPSSPFVPAQQDFVARYGVQSVLGFGGVLPDGNLFALIIFARVPTASPVAQMFRTIAVDLKLGLLALFDKPIFAA
jgi:hypothetical protein